VREDLLRHQGDLSKVEGVPAELVEIYQTSFQLTPYAFLEVAARAQKWIDQAISRNIYLRSRDVGEMVDLYAAAWRKGVKTTYYLHMMPRHTAEQSTVKVNKAQSSTGAVPGGGAGVPRRGFGAAAAPAARGFGAVATPVAEVRPARPLVPRGTSGPGGATSLEAPEVVPAEVDELDVVDGAACPVDPQERLQCDSCQ